MEYELRYGEVEDFIAGVAERQNTPLPDWLVNKPELTPGLEFFYQAFWELSTCRPLGFGVMGPIPWTALVQYAYVHELDAEQAGRLQICVREMDGAFLRLEAERAAKNDSGKAHKTPGNPGKAGRGRRA